ncbi:MAG: sigma-70 family RNA polymerase sigma factor [Planctomycetota bacterium]
MVRRYCNPLSVYARQWTEAFDDCVQDAFIELATADRPDNPVSWLFRVVRNKALNSSRSQRRRDRHESNAALYRTDSFKGPFDQLQQHEEQAHLIHSLDRLSNDDRELVVLRIWSGLTWKEIGELTSQPPSTAHRRYSVALEQLKKLMTKQMAENDE